jgi:hypothetical protein
VNRGKHDHCERPPFDCLLILQVLVAGNENLEALRSKQLEKFTVLDAAPAEPDDRAYLVTKELPPKWMWNVLIKQHFHG